MVFLDLETTGLNPLKGDKIIEICCLKVNDIFKKEIFHYYINPGVPVKKEAYLIHGINNNFLSDKPFFKKEIIDKFLNFIKMKKIVIHNAKFDLKFLNIELKNNNFKKISNYCYKIIDTLKLSNKLYKNKRNNLNSLCKRLKIKSYNRSKHSARVDVEILYDVYLNLLEKIKTN